ncbi:unnamed protein product, partial [marine sediment metagenome]
DTIGLLNRQAKALDRVASSAGDSDKALRSMRQGETSLRRAMTQKTKAVNVQSKAFKSHQSRMRRSRREFDPFQRAVQGLTRNMTNFSTFLVQLATSSNILEGFFRTGVRMGFPTVRMFHMMAAAVPPITVALSGLISALNGVVGLLLVFTQQAASMLGFFAVLPTAIGSAAAAAISFKGAFNAILKDSMTAGNTIAGLREQLAKTTDLEEREKLTKQLTEATAGLTKGQKGVAFGVADLKKQWKDLFTGSQKLQAKFLRGTQFAIS